MARKLSPGVHNVRIKTGKGSKTRMQRVKVNAKGQWKFLKNTGSTKKTTKKRTSPSRARTGSKKVNRTAKGKFFKNMSLVGAAEGVGWGFVGLSLLGPANPSSLPITRLVQGVQGHVLGRRGKARLMPAIIDLIDLWLVGMFKMPAIGKTSGIAQFLKVRPL